MQYDAGSIVVSLLSGSVGGSLTGAIAAHVFAGRDKRGERKSKFLRFMRQWESQVIADSGVYHQVVTGFVSKRHDFVAEVTDMEANYRWRKSRFRTVTDEISRMTPNQVNEDNNKLLNAIRDVIKFVR